MKKNFTAANIDRLLSGNNVPAEKEQSKIELPRVARNSPLNPDKNVVLPEEKVALPISEENIKSKVDKNVIPAKKRPDSDVYRSDNKQAPSYDDISVITDRQTYSELSIRLKENGKNIRVGLRDVIAELIANQSIEDIEQAIKSRGKVKGDVLYKTSVRIPHELYLDVFRFSKRNHIKLLQIVDAAISLILSS